MLPSCIDGEVLRYVQALRENGAVVIRHITLVPAVGIVRTIQSSLLAKHGGSLTLSDSWAESFLRRENYIKRKATKAAKKLPEDFEIVRKGFHDRFAQVVLEHQVPAELIVNLDQTGLKMVPVSEWTYEKQGAKQVQVTGIEDKRQITGLLAVSLDGTLLPPQLIYEGTTTRCHPRGIRFPNQWDIWHSESHWSTSETMVRYINEILVPFATKTKKRLHLPTSQWAVVVLDVFRAHCTAEVLDTLKANRFHVVFVPGNCTSQLQPLDLSVNGPYKRILKEKFTDW